MPLRTERWQGQVVHVRKRQPVGVCGLRPILRGKGSPLTDQQAAGGDAQRGMVVETSPASPFIVAEADLLFQVLIVTLDAPPEFRGVDQIGEADVFR